MAVAITSVIAVDYPVEVDDEEEEAFDDAETYASEDAPVGQRGRAIFRGAVAESQYDRTQACLAEAGLDSVVVYRGVR